MTKFKVNVIPEMNPVSYEVESDTEEEAIEIAQNRFYKQINEFHPSWIQEIEIFRIK